MYLHYDPYTWAQRGKAGPLARQRMDFLMLLRGRRWVVIEIDGTQHYGTGKQASPLRALKKSGQHQVAIPWMVREELVAQRVLRYAEVPSWQLLGSRCSLTGKGHV